MNKGLLLSILSVLTLCSCSFNGQTENINDATYKEDLKQKANYKIDGIYKTILKEFYEQRLDNLVSLLKKSDYKEEYGNLNDIDFNEIKIYRALGHIDDTYGLVIMYKPSIILDKFGREYMGAVRSGPFGTLPRLPQDSLFVIYKNHKCYLIDDLNCPSEKELLLNVLDSSAYDINNCYLFGRETIAINKEDDEKDRYQYAQYLNQTKKYDVKISSYDIQIYYSFEGFNIYSIPKIGMTCGNNELCEIDYFNFHFVFRSTTQPVQRINGNDYITFEGEYRRSNYNEILSKRNEIVAQGIYDGTYGYWADFDIYEYM